VETEFQMFLVYILFSLFIFSFLLFMAQFLDSTPWLYEKAVIYLPLDCSSD
jgi:hypothetical protein